MLAKKRKNGVDVFFPKLKRQLALIQTHWRMDQSISKVREDTLSSRQMHILVLGSIFCFRAQAVKCVELLIKNVVESGAALVREWLKAMRELGYVFSWAVERVLVGGRGAHAKRDDVNLVRRGCERRRSTTASSTARLGHGDGIGRADAASGASAASGTAAGAAGRAGRAAIVRQAREARVEQHRAARRPVDDGVAVVLSFVFIHIAEARKEDERAYVGQSNTCERFFLPMREF